MTTTMMTRRRRLSMNSETANAHAALDVLDAEQLRELLRDLLQELDDDDRGRLIDGLVARAARMGGGWVPTGPAQEAVAEIVSAAEAAIREGYAEPHVADAWLRSAAHAFQHRDYESARRIFGVLLPPIGSADLYLGQDELVGEVLSIDEGACATQYVLSVYMLSDPKHRATAVDSAIRETGDLGLFLKPLEELERHAVEPLPGIDEFVVSWRALVEKKVASRNNPSGWHSDEEQWLREVAQRMEGTGGLAALARSTCDGEDLRAWCRSLVAPGRWRTALSAFEEAAECVRDGKHWRGEFLDGAALCAQELGRKNLPTRLERAWREAPTSLRLRRWLGSVPTKARLRRLAATALESCPKRAARQRAILHLVVGDWELAAKLLARAPGLGWSDPEHPGHLLIPLFGEFLEGSDSNGPPARLALPARGMDLDELEELVAGPDEPRLAAPEVTEILQIAAMQGPLCGNSRAAVLAAMRKAAEKRIEGVTKKKRRRFYGHATQLVAACLAADPSPETNRWVQGLRARFSRYPALQRAFQE